MGRVLTSILTTLLLTTPALAWKTPAEKVATEEPKILEVLWEGSTDIEMLRQVRKDLESAKLEKIKHLRVTLISPGGPAIVALEIARLVRETSEAGVIVEIRGLALVASGGTFVLAAGTPGYRTISRWALFLVHAPQVGGGFFGPPVCGTYDPAPKTEEAKIINALLTVMRDSYARYTGKAAAEIEEWISCGNEQIGTGELAVALGIADTVEE